MIFPDSPRIRHGFNTMRKARPTRSGLSFFDLPGEIRNQIYRMALTTEWAFKKTPYSHREKSCYQLSPAILRANWQIYREARDILYLENLWIILAVESNIIDGPIGFNGKFLPRVSKMRTASITSPALRINIRYPPFADHTQYAPSRYDLFDLESGKNALQHYVLGPESIPFLVDCLWKTNNRHYFPQRRLGYVWFTYQLLSSPICSKAQLQTRLLEPFSEVWSCGRICVTGAIGKRFKMDFCSQIRASPQKVTKLIAIANKKIAQGNRALAKHQADDACYLFDQAFHFLMHQQYLAIYQDIGVNVYKKTLYCCMIHMARGLIALNLYEDAYQILSAIPHDHGYHEEQALRYLYCGIIKTVIGSMFHTPRGYQNTNRPIHERLQHLNLKGDSSVIASRRPTSQPAHYPKPTITSRVFLVGIGHQLPDQEYPPASRRMGRSFLPSTRLPNGSLPAQFTPSEPLPFNTHPSVQARKVYFDFLAEAQFFFYKAHEVQTSAEHQCVVAREFHEVRGRLREMGRFNVPLIHEELCEKWFGRMERDLENERGWEEEEEEGEKEELPRRSFLGKRRRESDWNPYSGSYNYNM